MPTGAVDFTNIPLETKNPEKKEKAPRRIIHFSDGVVEEYSTDEDEEDNEHKELLPQVNPKSLNWMPWMWYYMSVAASNSLYAADACGEKIAWFLGITSPKYQHAIDEYYKLKDEEEEFMRTEKLKNYSTTPLSSINVEVNLSTKKNSSVQYQSTEDHESKGKY